MPTSFPAVIDLSDSNGTNGFHLMGGASAAAADINNDGIVDIILSNMFGGGSLAGSTYVLFGHTTGPINFSSLNGSTGFRFDGEAVYDWYSYSGYPVSTTGDVNGDGFNDLIIGAFMADPSGLTDAGSSYVVFGKNTSWTSPMSLSSLNGTNGFRLDGEAAGDSSGISVSIAGDINGDGFDDLIIGAYLATPGGRNWAGSSYLVFGKNTSWTSPMSLSSLDGSNGFRLDGESKMDFSGYSVSAAGDINGDGFDDLIIGAYARARSAGSTYVVFGKNTSWTNPISLSSFDGSNGFRLDGEAMNDDSGYSVSAAGDINGDGHDDLIIGAASRGFSEGSSYVLFGKNTSWTSPMNLSSFNGSNGFRLDGETGNDFSGYSVSAAGDINNDGIADLIVGGYSNTYVLFGQTLPWDSPIGLSSLDGSNGFRLTGCGGKSVRAAGDVNGDGMDDLISLSDTDGCVVFGGGFPRLVQNTLTLTEGASVILSAAELDATGAYNTTYDATLLFIVDTVQQGQFEVINNPGSAITRFTQQQISNGTILFVHNAGELPPSYRVSLADGVHTTPPQNASITFILEDDVPVLGNNQLTVLQEGGSVVLTSNELSATDIDNTEASLVFTVSNVQQGRFERISNPGVAIANFTQQELVNATLRFVHDGSALAPAYQVMVSDGMLSTSPVWAAITLNHRPVVVNNTMRINDGETLPLTSSQLSVIDSDNTPLELTVTMTSVQHGQFEWSSYPGIAITNFTQAQINNLEVQFRHDGSGIRPNYPFFVSDGYITLGPIVPMVQLNLLPSLVNNALIVSQGETQILTVAMLSASDANDAPDRLMFNVTSLNYGRFEAVAYPGVAINMFTLQQIRDAAIQFVHDGSVHAPYYQVSVSDGLAESLRQAAFITFNNAAILTLQPIVLDQGTATAVTPLMMYATDMESASLDLRFDMANVTHGYFAYATNPTFQTLQFRQEQLSVGNIIFVHDGSDQVPSFALSVSDGSIGSPWQIPNVTLNHSPVVVGTIPNRRVTQNTYFSFALPSPLFWDFDGDSLNVSATLPGAIPLPDGMQFHAPMQRFSGKIYGESLLSLVVTGTDPRGLSASERFTLQSELSELDKLRALWQTVGIGVSVSLGVLGFLWLRKKSMEHRQGHQFADLLRKRLRLSYYDFDRFQGDVYKSKMNHLIYLVDATHGGLYSRLDLGDRVRFVDSVAQVMEQRPGLITSASIGSRTMNMLFFCRCRHLKQLNLGLLEYSILSLADEAVTHWKTEQSDRQHIWNQPDCDETLFRVLCCKRTPNFFVSHAPATKQHDLEMMTLEQASDEKKGMSNQSAH